MSDQLKKLHLCLLRFKLKTSAIEKYFVVGFFLILFFLRRAFQTPGKKQAAHLHDAHLKTAFISPVDLYVID